MTQPVSLRSLLILALSASLVLLSACAGPLARNPHAGGIYSVDATSLEAILPQELKGGLLPPARPMQNPARPVGTTYLIVKLYRVDPDSVRLKYSLQPGELPATAEHFQAADFQRIATRSVEVSRRDFDGLADRLTWIADGPVDDWAPPEPAPR